MLLTAQPSKLARTGPHCRITTPRILVDHTSSQKCCGKLYSEGVAASSTAFGSLATLVFPVFRPKEHDIHSSDGGDLAGLQPPGLINRITPNDIPAGMIVVGLQRPRPGRTFGFLCLFGRRIQLPSQ